MFKHILVPLDGSRLAEAALPAASHLAAAAGARVTLLHVLERNAPATVHGERHLTSPEEAEAYLAERARGAFPADLAVACHVHATPTADVVRSIVEHDAELAPDLVVLCTHGRGGLRSLLFGSIAQQVAASSPVPVLLIRPTGAPVTGFACQRILAPFDGGSAHAPGVETAADLARCCAADLHLVFVVPTAGTLGARQSPASRLLPAASRTMLEMASRDARECLGGWIGRLRSLGVGVTGEVCRGRPASVVARVAEATRADLVVLATHGRAGSRAFWAESVAQQILDRTRRPLLLVPVRCSTGE